MPKLCSIRRACCAALCGFNLILVSSVAAQTAPGATPVADPKAVLHAAAAVNGAPGKDAKPWHAKITFTLNDLAGKPESQGTIEEFWGAPDKIKIVYASSSFNQVEYTGLAGILRTGNRDGAPPEFTRMIDQFLNPIPVGPNSIDTAKLKEHDVSLGDTKLSCVEFVGEAASSTDVLLDATYCISQSAPILRLTLSDRGSSRIIRNGVTRFAGHIFPETVEEVSSISAGSEGTRVYLAKLETMEALDPVDDAQFTPPPDALPAPKVIRLDERVTRSEQVHHSYPQYDFELPKGSPGLRAGGLVVIALRVHTDGSVSPLDVVMGPRNLRAVSLDSVRKWTYKPFQVNGEPVEVITTGSLIYILRQ